ncbi:hypothetical protein [Amycolatopsis sp. MtRt-6]|uniref:hypothetical protein n=1 Tax=Amycolatopsis sp. MtRt-6 TaxID=2792782 RepID=UPI001A8E69F7|nr:hypothetical protein [Amycolatopsis sp. MtRt-6]
MRVRSCGAAARITSVVAVVFLVFSLPQVAHAHFTGSPGSGERIVVSLGGHELTFTMQPVTSTPGDQKIDVVTHAGQPAARLALSARNIADGTTTTETSLDISGPPGKRTATIVVGGPGQWELTADDGRNRALIPFLVVPPATPAWQLTSNVGWAAAGAFVFAAFAVSRAARSRRRWLTLGLTSAAAASVAVAITARVLSPAPVNGVDPASVAAARQAAGISAALPATSPELAPSYANAATRTDPAVPSAGQPFDLRLSLYDGATGRVLDDLRPQHAALIHLAAVSDDRATFAHVHPARVGPGEYLVRLTLPHAGAYTVYSELQRDGSGTQLITTRLAVSPEAPGQAEAEPDPAVVTSVAPAPGFGRREADGLTFSLAPSQPPAAGTPITVTADVSDATGPVRDLQPWLDMAAHLLLLGPGDSGTAVFGHVHEFDSMSAMANSAALPPDETVANIGPKLRFVFSFPRPGRYWLWLQTQRGYRVHTVPFQVEVP